MIATLSVIVPVYNARRTIALCMDALLQQTRPPDAIYFVDNGSTDGTYEWLRERAEAAPPVHVLRELKRGPAAARNAALRLVDDGAVAFTDADCVPEPDWLARLAEAYSGPAVAAVAGSISGYDPQTLIERCLSITGFPLPDRLATICEYRPSTVFYTANLSVRVDVLKRLGGFDESMPVGEDSDLCWRILQTGTTLVYSPSARVRHIHRSTLSAMLRRRFQYGASRPMLMRKHFHGFAYLTIGRRTLSVRARTTLHVNLTSPEKISLLLIALSVVSPWFLILLGLYWVRLVLLVKQAAQKRGVAVRSSTELLIFTGLHLLEFCVTNSGSLLASPRYRVLCT